MQLDLDSQYENFFIPSSYRMESAKLGTGIHPKIIETRYPIFLDKANSKLSSTPTKDLGSLLSPQANIENQSQTKLQNNLFKGATITFQQFVA